MICNNKSIRNIWKKIFTFLLMVFMFLTLSGCEISENNLKTQDEFTIRVFDSRNNEEKKSYERYYYDYKGSTISFVIKVYRNSEEIYETTLEDVLKNAGVGSLITAEAGYKEFYGKEYEQKQGNILPVEKGWYTYEIEFNRMYRLDGEIIQKHNLNDFFLDFYIDYGHYMNKTK